MKNVGIPYILYKKDHRDKQKTERSGVLMLMSMVFNLRIPRCRQLALQALLYTIGCNHCQTLHLTLIQIQRPASEQSSDSGLNFFSKIFLPLSEKVFIKYFFIQK